MVDVLKELSSTAVLTTAVAVQMGKINIYNASGGALAPALPSLSTLQAGATAVVVKYAGDASGNAVTVTRAGADTFVGGATTEVLNTTGQVRRLQVVNVSGTLYWMALEGFGGGSGGTASFTLIDAKGDLLVGVSDNTPARKPVGANGTWFKADSTTGDGTAWGTIGVADVSGLQTALDAKQNSLTSATITSSATPAINTDVVDMFGITALAVNITSMTTSLTGTPTGPTRKLWIYIVGTASRTIAWGTGFEDGAAALPTTTSGTQRLDVGLVWNVATSKWRCMCQGSS